MRKTIAIVIVVLAALVGCLAPAAAHAYQHETYGSFAAKTAIQTNAIQNFQSYGFNPYPRGSLTYGASVRHGDNDVTYDVGWYLPYYSTYLGCGPGFISDRFKVRMLGPDGAMYAYAIEDWGVAYRCGGSA